MLRPTAIPLLCFAVEHHLRLKARFLLLPNTYGFIDVGLPLWREDGSVVTTAAGPRQRNHSRVRVARNSWTEIRDCPNLEEKGPVFLSPRSKGVQIYPQELGSFSSLPTTSVAAMNAFEHIFIWSLWKRKPYYKYHSGWYLTKQSNPVISSLLSLGNVNIHYVWKFIFGIFFLNWFSNFTLPLVVHAWHSFGQTFRAVDCSAGALETPTPKI
jgi:hypothetical protein